ncbi:MAG: hypothetical protein J6N15_13460 [Ruminiclostridium sp.]|nr:hypothetical protein [Ruminiclostridium sp.]
MKKIITAAAAVFASAAMLTASVSAYMLEVGSDSDSFISDRSSWKIVTPASEDSPYAGAAKIEAVVAVEGDTEKYYRERSKGLYEDDNGEEVFTDFTGFLALGARVSGSAVTNDWWLQFDYHGLADVEGSSSTAAVTKLDDTHFLLTADLTGVTIDTAAGNATVSIADWGNKSEAYSLAVKEVFVYDGSGNVSVYSDGNGNITTDGHEPFDISKYVKPAETTAEQTVAAQTTAEQTVAAQTTAAPVTTAAQNTPAVKNEKADLGSRDSSLIIVGIVAGVIIVGVIVALVVVMLKRRNG